MTDNIQVAERADPSQQRHPHTPLWWEQHPLLASAKLKIIKRPAKIKNTINFLIPQSTLIGPIVNQKTNKV